MNKETILLGVNIDHVATLRNARGTHYPEPVHAALMAEQNGADSITIHLREDRRHIRDRDLEHIAQTIDTKLNLEVAVTDEMIGIAAETAPAFCCLVPERREEITTEGGLDVISNFERIKAAVAELQKAGTKVSLFIDADLAQIDAAKDTQAEMIEIHTGAYGDASDSEVNAELSKIMAAASHGHQLGIQVNAGHGLHYHNVQPVAAIPEIVELNIGHAIIARSVFTGLGPAVREMKQLMLDACR